MIDRAEKPKPLSPTQRDRLPWGQVMRTIPSKTHLRAKFVANTTLESVGFARPTGVASVMPTSGQLAEAADPQLNLQTRVRLTSGLTGDNLVGAPVHVSGVARTSQADAIQRQLQRSSFQLRTVCNQAGEYMAPSLDPAFDRNDRPTPNRRLDFFDGGTPI
jgi:hypothetical protein